MESVVRNVTRYQRDILLALSLAYPSPQQRQAQALAEASKSRSRPSPLARDYLSFSEWFALRAQRRRRRLKSLAAEPRMREELALTHAFKTRFQPVPMNRPLQLDFPSLEVAAA